MPDILDSQVCDLLREAEERLRAEPASGLTRPTTQVKDSSEAEKKNATKAELAVRQPQKLAVRRGPEQDNAGPDWFNLAKTDLTPEFKRDWQLLRMRGLLDPKHQKKSLRSDPPAYSRVGEVIPGPADFHGSRLTRKEKKRTIFEEITAAHNSEKLKAKYAGIQRDKTSGKRAFYQRLVSQRRKTQK
ncbi:hypothetical protein HIM_04437 [Hirsutella minnesotensis 3608]|uniref:Fcf2 pre-rRNA processing C-terminal domain-containing protein n=1 Tax=Hirsutella minnesotensis 3608 TaxID=1043627 RepID=A0A0F7ZL45_9HYPO|nr:hypothetical protein HIM_04437 [Hirsutella minnesotensis 3608]